MSTATARPTRALANAPQPTALADDLAWRRRVLLAIMAVTSIAPMFFVGRDEPTTGLVLLKLAAKTGSLTGTVLLVWQVALGTRHLIARVLPDLPWLVRVHRLVGVWGLALIALHPICITFYYERKLDMLPLVDRVVPPAWVVVGIVAFAIMLVIVATSLLASRLGYRSWYRIHVAAYLVLPLALAHGIAIGSTLESTALGAAFRVLAGLVGGLYLYRVVGRLRAPLYEVSAAHRVGVDAVELAMRPRSRILMPRTGQFVYVRERSMERGHPYSVSKFDAETGEMAITAKALGRFSSRLQELEKGARLRVDGPYGVFTQDGLDVDLPVVVIAGGIGITPFVRLIRTREPKHGRRDWLFYASSSADDIIYREELEAHTSFGIVHVLEDARGTSASKAHIEEGRVDADLLKKYLGEDLREFMFLLCGPPPMTNAVEEALAAAGVPAERIRLESFDL